MNEFLGRRGYKAPHTVIRIARRWAFESFAQPSFAGFWRVWNPFYGFYLARLYRWLGGDRFRVRACAGTFAVCGFLHDVASLIESPHQLKLKHTLAFLVFAVMVLGTSPITVQRTLRKWPWFVHVLLNVGFLVVGYVVAHQAWSVIQDMVT
jgi:hypothetical protein